MSRVVSDMSVMEKERGASLRLRRIVSKLAPLIGLVFVVALFSAMRYRTFCNLANFELILRQTAVVGTGALGMTLIIIAGGIDLSVGSMVSVVTVTIGLLLPHLVVDPMTGERHISAGTAAWIAAVGGIAVAALCGAINGMLITQLRLVPFIVTLGTMSALRGASEGLAHQTMVYPNDTILNRLLEPINPRNLWLLTPGVWIMLGLAVLVSAMLRYTRFGRHIFAIGSNAQTARLCGVRVDRATFLIYVLGGALTGVAGLLHFSYLTMGDPTTAIGMELDIIAAVVIGGASLNGGQGTILGSLVGALIMTVVADGCNKMDLQPYVQKIVTGAIIIFAVALDRLRHREVI